MRVVGAIVRGDGLVRVGVRGVVEGGDVALQGVEAGLVGTDVGCDVAAVGCVELVDELGDEVVVGGRAWLAWVGGRGCGVVVVVVVVVVDGLVIVVVMVVELGAQAVVVEGAQGVGGQTGAVVVAVGGNVGVGLQQVGGLCEGGGLDAEALEALEQQQGLERRVGWHADGHGGQQLAAAGGGCRAAAAGEQAMQRARRGEVAAMEPK